MSAKIIVVGSLNMDMVVKVDRRPEKGETILGYDFFTSPGGKGANQAYACGILGGSVAMMGRVGHDMFADSLKGNLAKAGVDVQAVGVSPTQASGIAMISIDKDGDNSIIVSAGANAEITAEMIRRQEDLIKEAELMIIQLEIPMVGVKEAVSLANRHHVKVLLDPAPAQSLDNELMGMIDYITPNQSEIQQLTGIEVNDEITAKEAAEKLLASGIKVVFAKLGREGVVVATNEQCQFIPPYQVEVVDTTAAGDAFAGALGVALMEGQDIWSAAKFANAVGALTVTQLGAQSSIPNRTETDQFMQERS